jgi:Rieske 2Fe-2S family protein
VPFSRSALDAVLAPLEQARPFPAEAYLDPAVLAAERRAIFDRSFRCVGLAEDVALPGAWIRAPESRLVALRGEDLVLRAMYDVCVHRGATLLDGDCGRIGRFECPYHGWTYDLHGRLRTEERAFRGARLHEARAEIFGPFVFVGPEGAAAPFDSAPRWLRDVPQLRRVHGEHWVTRANWKLLGENFQESHHFPRVHPGLEALTPHARSGSRFDDGPWLEGTMELERETVSLDGMVHGRPRIGAPRVHDALLFPTTFFSLQPDYLLGYRLTPLDAGSTRVDFDILAHPTVRRHECSEDMHDVIAFWARTNEEDRTICEKQQLGIASGAWEPLGYAASEDGTHAFDRKVAAALLSEIA